VVHTMFPSKSYLLSSYPPPTYTPLCPTEMLRAPAGPKFNGFVHTTTGEVNVAPVPVKARVTSARASMKVNLLQLPLTITAKHDDHGVAEKTTGPLHLDIRATSRMGLHPTTIGTITLSYQVGTERYRRASFRIALRRLRDSTLHTALPTCPSSTYHAPQRLHLRNLKPNNFVVSP